MNISIYNYLGEKVQDFNVSRINKKNLKEIFLQSMSYCFISIKTLNPDARWYIELEFEGEEIKIG